MIRVDSLTPQEIAGKLARPGMVDNPWTASGVRHLRHAAVLVPFLRYDDNTWHLLYTRRTDTVQDHKGQVSFPGGSTEKSDPDIIATALREAEEEIGLHPTDVVVLGKMSPIVTPSHYVITPVVAVIPAEYTFRPSPQEVDRIFTLPLAWLADSNHFQEKMRTHPDGHTSPVIYFNEYDRELLWGITAYITLMLIKQIS